MKGCEVVSLIAHMIAEALTPVVGRTFWRTVKRCPAAFGAVALAGQAFGVWAVGFGVTGDWALVAIGVSCLVFYTGLLALLAVKLRAGTWGAFCDWSAALFGAGGSAEPSAAVERRSMESFPTRSDSSPAAG